MEMNIFIIGISFQINTKQHWNDSSFCFESSAKQSLTYNVFKKV